MPKAGPGTRSERNGILAGNDQESRTLSTPDVACYVVSCTGCEGGEHPMAERRTPGRGYRIGVATTAIALAAAGAGCSSGASRANSPEKTTIVVGAVPAVDTAGLFIAQQQGYFAAEG